MWWNSKKSNCDDTKKNQIVIKLKKSNCDKTPLKLWQKSNCDKTQKLKMWQLKLWQNSKTQTVSTQKFWQNLKYDNSEFMKKKTTLKGFFSKKKKLDTLTSDEMYSAFCDLKMFFFYLHTPRDSVSPIHPEFFEENIVFPCVVWGYQSSPAYLVAKNCLSVLQLFSVLL